LYGVFGRPLRRWADQWALLEPSLDMVAIQASQAAGARRQALRFPPRVEQQRANSLRLLAHLGSLERVGLPHERPGTRYNYHLFPVVLQDTRERDTVAAAMWKQFVDTSTIYSGAVDACRQFGYRRGCPVAESVSRRLITLPNHAALSKPEIDAVAQAFLESLKACRAVRHNYPVMTFGPRLPVRR
jgi:dTDP-4-amino-4,6-dideoxygalactose transaminase